MCGEIQTKVEGRWHGRHLVVHGESVSRLSVLDASIWLLGVEIRMGGIGAVGTKREHRMKGYARRLLEDTVQYMTALGCDVSMLFGISDFYNKFGFISCLPDHRSSIATRDAEGAAEGAGAYTTRPVEQEDLPWIVGLYNGRNRRRPAALVREEEFFTGFREGSAYGVEADAFVMQNEDGERIGYAAFDDSRTAVNVVEVNVADWAAHWSFLHEFAKMAVERRCGEVQLHMASDDPFVRFARRYGCNTQIGYRRMGGGMMRILNQDTLFRKLQPALQERVARSPLAGRPTTVGLETDLATTELHFNGAPEADQTRRWRVKLGQDKLMQLVVGYRAADDLLADPDVTAEGDVRALLEVLFGGLSPYVWRVDTF
ncbi:MAG: GNAT family N-acetyltransferase [Candidatus Brocadiae bacterium]|nr:GNAT family N-acetyltransferase [Candidatus Brocadiia bacterium]